MKKIGRIVGTFMLLLHYGSAYSEPTSESDIKKFITSANRNKPSKSAKSKTYVDPAEGVYGLPFGAGLSEAYKHFGKPAGLIRENDSDLILIYGRTHLLKFRDEKLYSVTIDKDCVLGGRLCQSAEKDNFFDRGWMLGPDISAELSRERVSEILGEVIPERYDWSFERGGFIITLFFYSSGRSDTPDEKKFFTQGFEIRQHRPAP